MTYSDKRGYEREHSNLVHRHRAYHHIYLKDRKKYPLPFSAYEVHHIDGNKKNNRMDNLAVLTPEQHDKAHELLDEALELLKLERKRINKEKTLFCIDCNRKINHLGRCLICNLKAKRKMIAQKRRKV